MAEYFDDLAPKWGSNPSGYETREKLVSMMNLPPDSVIADIGCGKGVMFEHLLKAGPSRIIAVDISGGMINSAMNAFNDGRIEYVNEDFISAHLPMVDAAVIFNAYPHFLDKAALVGKLARIIKRNGVLLIAHGSGRSKVNGIHRETAASALSAPLEDAWAEAERFRPFFEPEIIIDDDTFYCIKMLRVNATMTDMGSH